MKAKNIYTYETRINGLDKEPYFLITKKSCFWNLTFDETDNFPVITINKETGKYVKSSNGYYQNALKSFKTLGIKNKDTVIILRDNSGSMFAITSKKQNLYIDVNDDFKLKSLLSFNILITSIQFY